MKEYMPYTIHLPSELRRLCAAHKPFGLRRPRSIVQILGFVFSLCGFTSCGLIDIDVDSDISQIAAEMKLNFDTAYVWKGFVVNLVPQFKPDSLNITDIYVRAENPEVVDVNLLSGRITAVGAGWTRLFVESVSAQIKDTCTVCVMELWDVTQAQYPYETVFYADVTLRGEPLTEDMVVAAFVGNECRAIGEVLKFHGISLMQLRVGAENIHDSSNIPDIPDTDITGDDDDEGGDDDDEGGDDEGGDDEGGNDEGGDDEGGDDGNDDDDDGGGGGPLVPDDGVDPNPWIYQETIVFRCYDKKKLRLYECPITPEFDGQTHGTLSNLYKIDFE